MLIANHLFPPVKRFINKSLLLGALAFPLLSQPLVAQQQSASTEALHAIVRMLGNTSDSQLQLDLLRVAVHHGKFQHK